MISNSDGSTLISSMGWVDRDALWCFDVPGRKVRCLPLNAGSDFLTIHPGGLERFSLTHDFKGSRFELTVHDFSDPSWVAARATFTNAVIDRHDLRVLRTSRLQNSIDGTRKFIGDY